MNEMAALLIPGVNHVKCGLLFVQPRLKFWGSKAFRYLLD